jgi:hypothetical protein
MNETSQLIASDGRTSYQSDPDKEGIAEIVRAMQRGQGKEGGREPYGGTVFLIGAGCSISAGIFSGQKIAEDCCLKLAECYSNHEENGRTPEEAVQWLKENNHFKAFNPYGQDKRPDWGRIYGHLFEDHFSEAKAQQEIIENAIKPSLGKINWAHLCLGELVNKRYVHTVLTTNFDQLVLDGIIRTGIIPVVADGVESLSRIKAMPSYPQVIHIHGSRHTYNPRNSSSALNAVKDNTMAISAITGILQEAKAFVVVGYAGGEEGVLNNYRLMPVGSCSLR